MNMVIVRPRTDGFRTRPYGSSAKGQGFIEADQAGFFNPYHGFGLSGLNDTRSHSYPKHYSKHQNKEAAPQEDPF